MGMTSEEVLNNRTVIDEFMTNKRALLEFPLLFIEDASDALPVIASSLKEGRLPLVYTYRDKLAELMKIAVTPENFVILFSIFKITLYAEANEKYRIENLFDITQIPCIEVEPWESL